MIYFSRLFRYLIIGVILAFVFICLYQFSKPFDGISKAYSWSYLNTKLWDNTVNNNTSSNMNYYLEKYSKSVPGLDSKFIILAMTDSSFTDMALNLYISSFKRFGIENFLFIGGGKNACDELIERNIQCFDFWEDPDSEKSNNFGSKEFNRKMNIRTEMILTALKLNYSVLHTDLDVVFLKNPMPEIENLLQRHSMAILWDHSVYNAGFLAIKNTPFSIEVYEDLRSRTNKSLNKDDQTALNEALRTIEPKYKNSNLGPPSIVLDKKRYLSGVDYFQSNRDFPPSDFTDNCPNCTVIHNNWIVSKEAKVHRFKETAMWYIDDDQYYSDENRKYLLYNNLLPKNLPNKFDLRGGETMALRTSFKIAAMLNRTLIIPRFHHDTRSECPLNSFFKIKNFYEEFFPNYRESSFLLNDLVPHSISMKPDKECLTSGKLDDSKKATTSSTTCNKQHDNSKSKCIPFQPVPIALLTKNNKDLLELESSTPQILQIIDLSSHDIIDESLIMERFNHCSDQVLVFSYLLEVKVKFNNTLQDVSFEKSLNKGLIPGKYIQL